MGSTNTNAMFLPLGGGVGRGEYNVRKVSYKFVSYADVLEDCHTVPFFPICLEG